MTCPDESVPSALRSSMSEAASEAPIDRAPSWVAPECPASRRRPGPSHAMDDGREEVRPTLDPAERRVVQLIAEGFSDREIAEQLGVPLEAVWAFLGAIFDKLGAGSKLEALIVAFRHGLIRPPPR